MKSFFSLFFLFLLIVISSGCKTSNISPQKQVPVSPQLLFTLNIDPDVLNYAFVADTTSYVIDKNLRENSGLLYSRINQHILWGEQDSGNGQFLYLYTTTGHFLKKIQLLNTNTHDAEDIAYGPNEKGVYNQIFLADIGDNKNSRSTVDIYTYDEPVFSDTTSIPSQMTAVKKIRLKYPKFRENAEALFVDPLTNRIYIFSKAASVSHVYTIDFPYNYSHINSLKHVGDINVRFQKVTAADISHDGMNILLKTYDYILYWKRKPGESLNKTFTRMPTMMPYKPEVQGEAVTWGKASDEYYTFSEESHGVIPKLFFYKKKQTISQQ